MFSHPRAHLKISSRQRRRDDERLLPYIELQSYPINTNSSASPESSSSYPVLKGGLQINPQSNPSRNRLRRLADSLKLGSYLDNISRRLQPHSSRDQWHILQGYEQLDYCDRVTSSPEAPLRKGQRRSRFWKTKTDSEADSSSWRSAVDWYFCSPTETVVKNCPTLEFLHVRLAPPGVWL